MFSTLFHKKIDIPGHVFNSSIVILQPIEDCKDGSIVRKSEFKAFDIAESLKSFSSSDFSLSNLRACGALSKMQVSYMPFTSSLSVADSFEGFHISSDTPKNE